MSEKKRREPRYRDMTDKEILDRCLALQHTFTPHSLVAELISRYAMHVTRDGDAKTGAPA